MSYSYQYYARSNCCVRSEVEYRVGVEVDEDIYTADYYDCICPKFKEKHQLISLVLVDTLDYFYLLIVTYLLRMHLNLSFRFISLNTASSYINNDDSVDKSKITGQV